MRIGADAGLGHLTYCTNIHAGEQWSDVADSLRINLPAIKRAVSPAAPLGVGLRISAAMAASLDEPGELEVLKALLGDDYYVFTVNGFPYGAFHGQPVKDGAYRPDWREAERLRYTNQLADVLALILPPGMAGSISTVPCSFKPWLEGAPGEVEAQCARNLASHAVHLWRLQQRTGVLIRLALEPEPFCLLETIDETVTYFNQYLFDGAGLEQFVRESGLGRTEAQALLRRYLAVCYDVCHAAVEFEDPRASVEALRSADIEIAKVQLSSALRVGAVDATSAAALAQFDEPVYLHQTMEDTGNGIRRYADLAEALARQNEAQGREWRSHFHVPIFLERMEHFDTTQGFLREVLALHRESPISEQLEVETYTWDVLPVQYRGVGVAEAIARELNWVLHELQAA